MLKVKYKSLNTKALLLLLVYVIVLLYCVLTEPIYSHDTYSYLRAMPFRQLGYVIFLKTCTAIFGSYLNIAVVFFHTVFSLFSVHYFFSKASKFFHLNIVLKIVLLAILLFPFFPPLSIANNICSEGIGYGL